MEETTSLGTLLCRAIKEDAEKEAKKQKVHAFLQLPYDYQIDWEERKEWKLRISSRGFLDPECKRDQEILSGIDLHWDWNYLIEVKDCEAGSTLPDTIYVTIYCSGYYREAYGGSSWFANDAYVSKENALNRIKDADSEWERWWVIEMRRRT